jgi:three-Cys-motif partner protein
LLRVLSIGKENGVWGGKWTEDKLDTFEKYVRAYLRIMNAYRDKYKWKLIYFDAFAGSGSRGNDDDEPRLSLTDLNIDKDELSVYKGSAERALSVDQRGFDYYYFVERHSDS